jgi:hypothetical protein
MKCARILEKIPQHEQQRSRRTVDNITVDEGQLIVHDLPSKRSRETPLLALQQKNAGAAAAWNRDFEHERVRQYENAVKKECAKTSLVSIQQERDSLAAELAEVQAKEEETARGLLSLFLEESDFIEVESLTRKLEKLLPGLTDILEEMRESSTLDARRQCGPSYQPRPRH